MTMKCAEFEKLIDAYSDGELSGSLRLEFDAHRLRCRRCQLMMVMTETIEHVVSSDRRVPALSDGFADRVMARIEQRRPLSVRLRSTRVAVVAGALVQAAAILYLAVVLPARSDRVSEVGTAADTSAVGVSGAADQAARLLAQYRDVDISSARQQALVDYIWSRVEAAGVTWASDLSQMARYASNLSVPGGAGRRVGEGSPLRLILEAIAPVSSDETEPAPNQHRL